MIKIGSLRARNFRIFEDIEFSPLQNGITCIIGPNGSGKSTIIEAIKLAITGSIRNRKSLINLSAQREKKPISFVELDVVDERNGIAYTIRRQIAPDGEHLLLDGDQVVLRGQEEVNRWVSSQLGYPVEMFDSIACCEQWDMFKILVMQDAKRDKLLSGLIDINHIEETRKKLLALARECMMVDYNQEYDTLQAVFKTTEGEIIKLVALDRNMSRQLASMDEDALSRELEEVSKQEEALRMIRVKKQSAAHLVASCRRLLDREIVEELKQVNEKQVEETVDLALSYARTCLDEEHLQDQVLSIIEQASQTIESIRDFLGDRDPDQVAEELEREMDRLSRASTLEQVAEEARRLGFCPVCGSEDLSRVVSSREATEKLQEYQRILGTIRTFQSLIESSNQLYESIEAIRRARDDILVRLEKVSQGRMDRLVDRIIQLVRSGTEPAEIQAMSVSLVPASQVFDLAMMDIAEIDQKLAALGERKKEISARLADLNRIKTDRRVNRQNLLYLMSKRRSMKKRLAELDRFKEQQEKLSNAIDHTMDLCELLIPSNLNPALVGGYCSIIAEQASKILDTVGTPYRVRFDGGFFFFNGRDWMEAKWASGGQKVLAGLAIRLAIFQLVGGKNTFFLMDEPAAGLDRENVLLLANMLDSLSSAWPWCQIVLVTHDENLIVPGSMVFDLGEEACLSG